MRRRDVVVASLALILIGTLEARESAQQIEDLSGPLRLTSSGAGLTALGFAASAVVYLALGWRAADDARALRAGVATGALAGLVGGTLRAALVSDAVRDVVQRRVAVPEWFVPGALAVFVVGSVILSAVGGAAIAFAGVRVRRARSGSSATSETTRAERRGEAQAQGQGPLFSERSEREQAEPSAKN